VGKTRSHLVLEAILQDTRVLVIEDDAAVRDAMVGFLELFGASVRAARNGHEGLERYDTVAPDLIFCDLRMPKMDGWEFLRRLRAGRIDRRVPVIAVSSAVELEHVRLLGFDGCLSKPFDADELARVLDRAVLRPRRREAAPPPGGSQEDPSA